MHADESRARRRAALTVRPNPRPATDYLVGWRGGARLADGPVSLLIDYVPDRLILAPQGLNAALGELAAQPWEDLESLAVAFHEDLLNALVPRWLRLVAARGGAGSRHRVTLEERQPGWANRALIG